MSKFTLRFWECKILTSNVQTKCIVSMEETLKNVGEFHQAQATNTAIDVNKESKQSPRLQNLAWGALRPAILKWPTVVVP